MKSTSFNFISISDVHLGNKRNTTKEIIANLQRELSQEILTDLDAIFFCGDLFDRLLMSGDMLEIDLWILDLAKKAKLHDVVVFFLEGTPSHDWQQSARFVHVNQHIANIGAQLHYVKELSIWYEEKFNMNFLFVPDEWSSSTDSTLSQVRQLLKLKNLDKVDYAFMHGSFDYQVPDFLNIPKHNSSEYLKLVKYLIFIGHEHTYSNFDRIYAQGSFDRMSHGQEEPKGMLRVTQYPNDECVVQFIENKGAKRFVTLDYTNKTLEEILESVIKDTEDLPIGSFVRIKAPSKHPVFMNMDQVIRRVIHCKWEKNPVDESRSERIKAIKENKLPVFVPIEITPTNIRDLLKNRLNSLAIDQNLRATIDCELEEILKTP